jgi:hypothetical protein
VPPVGSHRAAQPARRDPARRGDYLGPAQHRIHQPSQGQPAGLRRRRRGNGAVLDPAGRPRHLGGPDPGNPGNGLHRAGLCGQVRRCLGEMRCPGGQGDRAGSAHPLRHPGYERAGQGNQHEPFHLRPDQVPGRRRQRPRLLRQPPPDGQLLQDDGGVPQATAAGQQSRLRRRPGRIIRLGRVIRLGRQRPRPEPHRLPR